jgi:hypothetical protein
MIMLLSEAILLGSVGSKQAFDYYNYPEGHTCGMGAAMVGAGLIPTGRSLLEMYKRFPYLETRVEGPQGCGVSPSVWGLGATLWTRPQIAAWVAEKEKELGIVKTEAKEETPICSLVS